MAEEIRKAAFGTVYDEVSVAPNWHYGFSRYGAAVKDLRPVFKQIADNYMEGIAAQFATEGEFGGENWAPLSQHYARWKERVAPGMQLLVLTGRFISQMMNPQIVMTNETLEISVEVGYADERGDHSDLLRWHQFGTDIMPARPVMVVTDEQKYLWVKIFQRHFVIKDRSHGGYRYR